MMNLELSGLREAALDHLHSLNSCHICLGRVVQYKAHPGNAVADRSNVFFSAYQRQELAAILFVFAHKNSSCLNDTVFFVSRQLV